MNVIRGVLVGLLWAGLASAAGTAPAANPTAAPALTSSRPAAKRAAIVPRPGAKPKVARTTKAASETRAAKREAHAPARAATRTLQDIHIEGEIPVPQVLFITARDQRRFLDSQHRRYLRTSQQVGEQTVLPSWIGVTSPAPTDARKENPR